MHQINALMEGQQIQLEDRRICSWSRALNIKKNQNIELDEENNSESYYTSQVYHNYSFRFAKPRLPGERVQNKLNIKELKLPMTLAHDKYNNTNTTKIHHNKQRKKRHKLGLKPLKLLAISPKQNEQICEACKKLKRLKLLEEDNDNALSDTTSDYREEFTSKVNYDINDVDFDFDVLRLIMNEECNNNVADDCTKKISNHVNTTTKTVVEDDAPCNVNAQVEDDSSKNHHIRGRKIRFTLSKPQSPRTVQVIRVDVTSSAYAPQSRKNNENLRANHRDCSGCCSSEDDDDEDDYCRRFRRDYGLTNCNHEHYASASDHQHRLGNDVYGGKESIDEHVEFTLFCKKLTLSPKK